MPAKSLRSSGHQRRRAALRLDRVVEFLEPADGPGDGDDMGAGLGERQRRGAADAARGAGDDRDAAGRGSVMRSVQSTQLLAQMNSTALSEIERRVPGFRSRPEWKGTVDVRAGFVRDERERGGCRRSRSTSKSGALEGAEGRASH